MGLCSLLSIWLGVFVMNNKPRKSVGAVSNERSRERTSTSPTNTAGGQMPASTDRVLREPEITRDAVVLRAELRGFTQIAERRAARDLTPLVDEYLALLTEAVAENGGDIYQVDGDSLIAGFGIRVQKSNGSAERALRAAQKMLARFESLAERWRDQNAAKAAIGIGIHEGEVLTAELHTKGRQSQALLGDTVNVAECLSHRARAGEAVLSGTVRNSLTRHGVELQAIALPKMPIPGRSTQVDLFCLPRAARIQLEALGARNHRPAAH
jgi:class 3 adenylate cyclase